MRARSLLITYGQQPALPIAVLLLACSCITPAQGNGEEPLGPGDHTRTVTAGEETRPYLIHVPPTYSPDTPTPVVLAFHGAGINAQVMALLSGLNKKADEAGFIAVYPNGSGWGNMVLTWNAGDFPRRLRGKKPDDVAFTAALLDHLASVANIDPKRVYATGLSNGGMMCYRLAAELSHRIAAIAPVGGTLAMEQWTPARPVPVVHFHGTADRLVPFDGPRDNLTGILPFKSVSETIHLCIAANGCAEEPSVLEIPDAVGDGTAVVRSTYAPNGTGAEVVLYRIEEGGHTWPGQPPPNSFLGKSTMNIVANDLIWEFFGRHTIE